MNIVGNNLKDPQQYLVYAWEAEHVEKFDNVILSNSEVVDMIVQVAFYLNIPKPFIKLKKSNANCRAYPLENLIVITQWGKTATTVLHELAHISDYQITRGRSGMGHGPFFLGIAIILYQKFLNINKNYLMRTAHGMGLRFINLSLNSSENSGFYDEEI